MTQKYTFRKIRSNDKERLMKIVEKLWGGNDFVPRKFDDWIDDENGEFTAIEHEGQIVGCGRLDFITKTDAWLQALRKDANFEGKGVGFALTNYYVDKLKNRPDVTSIRFATYFKNHSSIRLNTKAGFRVAKTFSMKSQFIVPSLNIPKPEFEQISVIQDSEKALDYISKSPYFKYHDNFIHENWIVYPYSDDIVERDFIKKGTCFGIVEGDTIKALALPYIYFKNVSLSFFDADDFKYAKLLMDYVKLFTKEAGHDRLSIYTSEYPKLKKWLVRMFFRSMDKENDFLLFEYPLEKGQPESENCR